MTKISFCMIRKKFNSRIVAFLLDGCQRKELTNEQR